MCLAFSHMLFIAIDDKPVNGLLIIHQGGQDFHFNVVNGAAMLSTLESKSGTIDKLTLLIDDAKITLNNVSVSDSKFTFLKLYTVYFDIRDLYGQPISNFHLIIESANSSAKKVHLSLKPHNSTDHIILPRGYYFFKVLCHGIPIFEDVFNLKSKSLIKVSCPVSDFKVRILGAGSPLSVGIKGKVNCTLEKVGPLFTAKSIPHGEYQLILTFNDSTIIKTVKHYFPEVKVLDLTRKLNISISIDPALMLSPSTITVKVLDGLGIPVKNAIVKVKTPIYEFKTLTNSNGVAKVNVFLGMWRILPLDVYVRHDELSYHISRKIALSSTNLIFASISVLLIVFALFTLMKERSLNGSLRQDIKI
ncbi:MAG: hypothetical protein DRJ31_04925 [Candidatus Methanomethylicota archaeon]|uniref:Uncharacterized protein n=1 Tax=Thermoproteota archaeon TaxID=2056631 RepID=A0A497EQV8_9CREN|nr:MAG: hypothetical protein DRJ31_04925 [Candidatus Verstraetearchaeota archaeon]